MLVIGMLVIYAGYTVGSYGWVLLKGWDIPFRAWVSPLHPYTWPAGGADPPPIPATQLFPSSASTSEGAPSGKAGSTAASRAGAGASAANRPAPGSVQSRL